MTTHADKLAGALEQIERYTYYDLNDPHARLRRLQRMAADALKEYRAHPLLPVAEEKAISAGLQRIVSAQDAQLAALITAKDEEIATLSKLLLKICDASITRPVVLHHVFTE